MSIPISFAASSSLKLIRMPARRPPTTRAKGSPTARETFRMRYDELEARRSLLVLRLRSLSSTAQDHPGYKRAFKLLNNTFRKSKLTQRLGVLQAATWLIDLLERVTTIL